METFREGFLRPDDFIPSLLSWFELHWPEIFSSYRTNQPLFYFRICYFSFNFEQQSILLELFRFL